MGSFCKFAVLSAITLQVLAFTACSDDNSSKPTSDNGSEFFDEDAEYTAYPIEIDHTNQTITIYESISKERCINENGTHIWKDFGSRAYTSLTKYRFAHDSLFLYGYDDEDSIFSDEAFSIAIGNESGQILGKWKDTGCYELDNGIECDSYSPVNDLTYFFTEDTLKVYTKNNTLSNPNLDFINSYYISEILYTIIYGDELYPGPSEIFSLNIGDFTVDLTLEKNNIVPTTRTHKALSFNYNSHLYSINIEQADNKNESGDIKMTVRNEEKTCSLDYHGYWGNALKQVCNDNGTGHFVERLAGDEEGNEYIRASNYFDKDDPQEFSDCIMSLK
ncbi:hypothetical protein [Fibrobacter sp.]|uniref:hypothetical protein n=1 Tax=Fibrobacter sp. TaxID=35828 RepID=UPI00388EA57B